MTIIIWNDVVTSEVDGVRARNLEENSLILGDSDVEWLLVVLWSI